MSAHSSREVSMAIRCPACCEASQQVLSRLITLESVSCHHCGRSIDLQSGHYGFLIQELAQACARADVALSKGG